MRILMTADAVGGIWTYATDLAAALSARGAEVTVAVVGPGFDTTKLQAGTRDGYTLVDLGHVPEWLARGPEAVRAGGAALAALARDTTADLIHLNHPALAADTTLPCPMLAVCHSCVSTWWSAVRGTPLPDALAWQAASVGAGYRAAAALVAPSEAFARATQVAYGLRPAPEVVFNGRSAAPVPRGTCASPAGLTVGRLWDEGKDVATLDRAAALTATAIQAVGPVTGPNGAAVALRHLQEAGTVDEGGIRALLAARPVYLSAARYEPFGLAVLEAAQAGCALVLSDIPTFREVWGEVALFVPPGDAAGFAAALDRLVDDSTLRAQRGAAAMQRAADFSLAQTVERLLTLYATLLGRPARAPGPRARPEGEAA